MGAVQVNEFLTHLAVNGNVSASTQNQALSAILFLYRHVLDDPLPWLDDLVRVSRARRPPVVLTRDEVRAILGELQGIPRLVATLLYGTGLRLLEGLRLRVKDIDFMARLIVVRDGKGEKDRRTMLPKPLIEPIERQLQEVRGVHETDLAAGFGDVWLPYALARKYPNAGREWAWQYAFPAIHRSRDPRDGETRRHHLDESTIQKAVKQAVRRTGIAKAASCHTFRHCAASPVMPSRCPFTSVFEVGGSA